MRVTYLNLRINVLSDDAEHLVQDDTKIDLNPYKSAKWNTARADPDNQQEIPIAIHYAKITLKIIFAIFVLLLNLRNCI